MFSSDPQDLLSRLQEAMQQTLHGRDLAVPANRLLQATSHALSAGGKLLRGRMLLEACRAVGGEPEQALCAAVAVEYLHLGTLIHDDMIDGDELRRGKAAIWHAYGSEIAILSGDFLYFAAYRSLARSLDLLDTDLASRILEIFSTASMNLCLGQALEEKLAGNCSASYADYLEVVRLKTARLFRAALEIGTLLGGGSAEQAEAAGAFAEHLGIAFQITDDLLPFTSDSATIGKPVTSDIKNHRLTAPILYALATAGEADREILRAIFVEGHFDNNLAEAHKLLQKILARTQVFVRAEQEVTRYYQDALRFLHVLPETTGRDQLFFLANRFLQRKK